MLVDASGGHFGVGWDWLRSKPLRELVLLVDDHGVVLVEVGTGRGGSGFEVAGGGEFGAGVEFGLELALLELLLDALEGLKIFAVGVDLMKSEELVVSVGLLGVVILAALHQFAVPLHH